jgi:hypothetical protein
MNVRKVMMGLALVATLVPARAFAADEPWSDDDPKDPAKRYSRGDFGFRGGAEYRAQWLYVHPISLATETARNVSIIQQRLRLDATFDYLDKIRIVF